MCRKIQIPKCTITSFYRTFDRLDYNNEEDSEIFVMDVLSKALTRLTDNNFDDGSPIWSPDGSKIAYSSQGDVWIMDANGANKGNLTQTPGATEANPSWSPNGSEMVFDAYPTGGSSFDRDIYRIDTNTRQITRLTFDSETSSSGRSYKPSWSINSDLISFISRRCNPARTICGNDIYLINSQGNDGGRVTNDYGAKDEVALSWSPDGKQLVYQYMISDGRGYSELWVVNADGSNNHKILDVDDVHNPHWGLLKTK